MSAWHLEQQLKDAESVIKLGQSAFSLAENKQFNEVILKHFCMEECARYAHASADPALNPVQRADALAMAQAAGHLKRFLSITIQMGRAAEEQMGSLREAIDEARREEGGE